MLTVHLALTARKFVVVKMVIAVSLMVLVPVSRAMMGQSVTHVSIVYKNTLLQLFTKTAICDPPCENDGTCVAHECQCTESFTGPTCTSRELVLLLFQNFNHVIKLTGECVPDSCENGGTCFVQGGKVLACR